MTDVIKEALYINVNHVMKSTLLYHRIALCQGVFRTPVWPEAVAPLMELCFADRLQNLQKTLLNQSVGNRRDSQGTGLTGITFRDFRPAYRLGLVLRQPPFYIVNECCACKL